MPNRCATQAPLDHKFLIQSSVEGHLASFHDLSIVDNAAMNIGGAYGPSLHYVCIFGVNTQECNGWIIGQLNF